MRIVMMALLAAASVAAFAAPAHATLGQRYASQMKIIKDPVTGRTLHMMTDGTFSESKLYPTDQQWAFDNKHIIFRSGSGGGGGGGGQRPAGAPAQGQGPAQGPAQGAAQAARPATVPATPPAAPPQSRATGEGSQIFAMDDTTGEIVQITGGQGGGGTSSIMVSRKANKVYYLRRVEGKQWLISIDLTSLLRDSKAGKMSDKGDSAYETRHFALPDGFTIAGGFTIDADDSTAYFGYREPNQPPPPVAVPGAPPPPRIAQGPGGLMAFNLATGAQRVLVKTTFTVGHIQANPFKAGEVMYCNETGGDAATRMWIVSGDGSDNRPVYVEGPDDWVTHEQFADADTVIFNMMGHNAKLRKKPSGIYVVNLRNEAMENLGQVPVKAPAPEKTPRTSPNSYWHNGVTYDGKWAAGDDFDGNLWLLNRTTGEQTRISAGHLMLPDHIHPSFSPDGTKIYFQSGMLTAGARQHLVIIPIADLVQKK